MSEKPANDRTDIGFDQEIWDEVEKVRDAFHLKDAQDVARIAIAYAARLEVKPTASDLRSGGLKNLLKGSALDQSGAISSILKVMYPDNSDLEAYPNLCLEYMMNEGIRLLKRALDRGDLTNLENLMPEMVTSGE